MWKTIFTAFLVSCAAPCARGGRPFLFARKHPVLKPQLKPTTPAPNLTLQQLRGVLGSADGSVVLSKTAIQHFGDIMKLVNDEMKDSVKIGDVWVTNSGKVESCKVPPCKIDNTTVKFTATKGSLSDIKYSFDYRSLKSGLETSSNNGHWSPFSLKIRLSIDGAMEYTRSVYKPEFSFQIYFTALPKDSELQADIMINPVSCQISVVKESYSVPFSQEWCPPCTKMEKSRLREEIKNQIIAGLSKTTGPLTKMLKDVLCAAYTNHENKKREGNVHGIMPKPMTHVHKITAGNR